jgi:hypothetical protein
MNAKRWHGLTSLPEGALATVVDNKAKLTHD